MSELLRPLTEAPESLFFYPEFYYLLAGLEGRIPVRLYDASVPEPASDDFGVNPGSVAVRASASTPGSTFTQFNVVLTAPSITTVFSPPQYHRGTRQNA